LDEEYGQEHSKKGCQMRIICFPHFYYLSEVSRLVEMGLDLRDNMRRLKSLQDKVDGPAVAASEIVKFLGASNKNKEVVK